MHFSVIILLLIEKSEESVSFHVGSSDEGDVLSCVNRIVKHHFDSEHQVTILTQGSKDYVKGMESTVRLIANTSKPDKTSWFPQTKQAVVFLDGDLHRDLKILMSLGTFHPRSRFLIVCTIGDTSLSTKNYLIKVVQHLHQNQRWMIAIALKSIDKDIDLYGYTKTAYGNCGNPEILSFGNCSSEESVYSLFSSTLNYNQCPLRLATFEWPPFTTFIVKNGQKKSVGIDSTLVNIIVERLNASTSFLDAAPSDIRSMIGNHDADIGYGQMGLYESYEYSYTKSYSFVQGFVLVPKLSSMRPPTLNTFVPLETTEFQVWIALILVVIFVAILRSFLQVFKFVSVLKTLALFIGLGITARPTRPSQRVYFMSLVCFGYIITQAYLANLTMIFTKANDQGEIESLDELDESTIPLGGAIYSRILFEDKYPRLFGEYQDMNLSAFKDNLLNLKDGKKGIAAYVEVSKYLNYDHWKHTTIIPEVINSYPISMLVPNASTILPTCDWMITAVVEAGLMDYWGLTVDHEQMKGDALAAQTDDDYGRTNLLQILTIFRFLGIALGLSTAVFIIELLVAFWRTN